MKHFNRPLRSPALAAIAVVLSFAAAPLALAQGKANVGKLSFDALPSPDVSIGKNKSYKPKDWLEVEAEITVPAQNADQKTSGFIDQVTVKWHVAVKNPDGKGTFKLSKDINHINVPVGEAVYSSVYLSPNTLKRLTGSDRASKGAVEVVGLEVLVNGVKVGEGTSKMQEGWWNSASLSDQSSRFPLLNKNETPFAMFWYDRYAEIQKER